MKCNSAWIAAACCAVGLLASGSAPAQQPADPGWPPPPAATAPPAQPMPYGPAPGWGTPYPQYPQYPPYQTATPYQPLPHPYGAPPPPMPTRMPWREGDPIPTGYHVASRPRTGFVTAGWVVGGIGYGFGVMSALAADFANESSWLAVPVVGPWMTLGRRDYGCSKSEDPDAKEGLSCVGDVFAVMGLITDGIMQTLGGTFLLIGYTATKQELVKDQAFRVMPMRVGTGYGAGVGGAF